MVLVAACPLCGGREVRSIWLCFHRWFQLIWNLRKNGSLPGIGPKAFSKILGLVCLLIGNVCIRGFDEHPPHKLFQKLYSVLLFKVCSRIHEKFMYQRLSPYIDFSLLWLQGGSLLKCQLSSYFNINIANLLCSFPKACVLETCSNSECMPNS